MNTAFSLTETVMRHLLCPLMVLNATNASNGNAPDAVHNCAATRLWLEQDGQRHAMAHYHWTVADFRRRFYKNYLDITED